MSKKTKYIWFVCIWALGFAIASCTKEPAIEANVSIEILDDEPLINTRIPLVINGSGDFCTLYSGSAGKIYDSLPNARGQEVNFGDTVYVAYARANVYKLTAIASSYGNWANDDERAITTKDITVNDFETGISRVFMTEPKYRLATISNDSIYIDAGDIDLSNVSLQVITLSQDALVYPNSNMDNGYPGGEEFNADFSAPSPHILVESFSKTTQTYPLIFK